MFINERQQIKVCRGYDVAVCGGGFAGIAAALAAARQGAKTVLFEKQYLLGGLGTAGIVTIYLPLCDGYGHQVSFGIAEELLRLSIQYGAEDEYPDNWLTDNGPRDVNHKRFKARYNPQLFAILAERLLKDAGVDILYGTYVVGAEMEGDKISHLITESKSGRLAYGAKAVVDATGDCDIAVFAEAPTETFHQGNVLAAWYYSLGRQGYQLNPLGCADIPEEEKTEQTKEELLVNKRFAGLDGEEISEMVRLSHDAIYRDFIQKRENDPACFPVTMATLPQLRMTRKIVGEYTLSEKELHTYFDDSIGMVANWKKRGPVYEVPYRSLYSAAVKNLICAGRCTSVTETMWDIMRVIPCCAVTGQAAGTAAALTGDFSALEVKTLQKRLQESGVALHEKDL